MTSAKILQAFYFLQRINKILTFTCPEVKSVAEIEEFELTIMIDDVLK